MKFRVIAFSQQNTRAHNRLGLSKLSLLVHFYKHLIWTVQTVKLAIS